MKESKELTKNIGHWDERLLRNTNILTLFFLQLPLPFLDHLILKHYAQGEPNCAFKFAVILFCPE